MLVVINYDYELILDHLWLLGEIIGLSYYIRRIRLVISNIISVG